MHSLLRHANFFSFFVPISVHILFISWIILTPSITQILTPSSSKLKVKTISLNRVHPMAPTEVNEVKEEKMPDVIPISQKDSPPAALLPESLPQKIKEPPPVKKNQIPPTPKVVKTQANKKKVIVPPKPIAKASKKKQSPPIPSYSKELLAQAQESLAKIQPTSDNGSTTHISQSASLRIPELKSTPVSLNGEMSQVEQSYREELSNRIRERLRLPEFGEVQVKLTLERSGKVLAVEVVKAESQMNKIYVNETFPSVVFPSFGNRFGAQSQYTFRMTLANE
jgi:colicin import membrane protein